MPKAKETEQSIVIPAIEIQRAVVTIIGRPPGMMTNKFREDSLKGMEDAQQGRAKQKKAPRNPDSEFRGSLHIISKGKYGFPSAGIKKSLVAAGGRFADETMTVLRGVLNVDEDLVLIQATEPEMRKDFVMLNGGKGPASIAYRPWFRQWKMEVPIAYMSNMITKEQILNLFQIAGFSVGIGPHRPEKSGNFGRFEVKGITA